MNSNLIVIMAHWKNVLMRCYNLWVFPLAWMVFLLGCGAHENRSSPPSAPLQTFRLNSSTNAIIYSGKGGYAIFGCSGGRSNQTHYAYSWEGERLVSRSKVYFPRYVSCGEAYISIADQWLFTDKHASNEIIILHKAGERKILDEYYNNVYVSTSTVSDNGNYVGIALSDNRGTAKRHHPIGMYDVAKEQLTWLKVSLWRDPFYEPEVALPSNDGKYIAVAGTGYHLLVIDAATTNRLWRMSEDKEDVHAEVSGIRGVAFSPNGETLYFGEGMGYLYRMETRSGKVLGRWEASTSGGRFQDVAASPDGRYVAGGTGPAGEIFVWDVVSGEMVNVFIHGWTVNIVQFSPDSKNLASMAGGTIKVWSIK